VVPGVAGSSPVGHPKQFVQVKALVAIAARAFTFPWLSAFGGGLGAWAAETAAARPGHRDLGRRLGWGWRLS
jgi:hypothetical protein